MADIDIPHNWAARTIENHPESTDLVNTVSWFEHQSAAQVIIWEGKIQDLEENERIQVEVRSPESEILESQGFEEDELQEAYQYAQSQMEMYPVQEVIKEE